MADVIVYRYDEKVGRYGGVPARDLTQADVNRLSLKLQAALGQEGSPYTRVEAGEGPNLAAMTRDDLNAFAATQGVASPEGMPNKEAVITAIEEAAQAAEGGE